MIIKSTHNDLQVWNLIHLQQLSSYLMCVWIDSDHFFWFGRCKMYEFLRIIGNGTILWHDSYCDLYLHFHTSTPLFSRSCESKDTSRIATPPRKKALLRDYSGMANKPLTTPYFLGGGIGGFLIFPWLDVVVRANHLRQNWTNTLRSLSNLTHLQDIPGYQVSSWLWTQIPPVCVKSLPNLRHSDSPTKLMGAAGSDSEMSSDHLDNKLAWQ